MESEKRQYHKMLGNFSRAIIAVCVFALCLVLAAFTSSYSKKLDDELFEERKVHLLEFTEKTSEIIQETIDFSWQELASCKYILVHHGQAFENKEALMDLLSSMNNIIDPQKYTVLVFDDKGTYYSSDGNTGYWEDNNMFNIREGERQQVFAEIPHMDSANYLCFSESVEDGPEMEGGSRKITQIALAINSKTVKDMLSISGFGNQCYSYIVNSNGRRLFKYRYDNNFVGGYNIFSSISGYKILHGGSFEDFKHSIQQNGQSMALEFLYTDAKTGEEREWFVANADIPDVDWQVLLFVPTDVLGYNTDIFLAETTHTFMIVSVIIIIIFFLMMLVIISGRADKRIIKEKEATNVLLEEAALKAENANKAKSEFLSHMSHDIRTPINAIMGMTGIALKSIDDRDRVQDCLHKIESSSQHLFSLINDVLDMSRIESGKTTLNIESFNLSACLANCASIINGQISDRKLELVQDFEKLENPMVLGDELHLRQIFINILGNSVKFTPDGGKIWFRARQTELDGKTAFCFVMEDNGIGMKPEFLPHLFEAFAQEDGGSRTTYKGTGLGMAIVKQFVDMMGGTIEVESTLNVGTTFTVTLPMEIDQKAKPQEEEKKEDDFHLDGMKVLLVEDNELNMEIARELLEDQGVIVTTAENGQIAVDLFEQSETGAFDAILMDIMMPVMDGLTAAKTIRASSKPDATTIPILAMTANAYDEDVKKTREAGMNSHLSKPINVQILYATLSNFYAAK